MGRETVYSDHTIKRMAERNISADEIRLVINNPDSTAPANDGATNAWRRLHNRNLRVTYIVTRVGQGKQKKSTMFVITVAVG